MKHFNEQMMRRALVLARRGVGRTSPNPAVGCVVVKDGAIIGEGWHRKAGTPHAEVHALLAAGENACGADVYVTLEPCSHHGKTPPCADALVAAGVGQVFAGMVDPNPKVSGKGLARLRQAGIAVHEGLLEKECRQINEPFIKHVATGMPFVICKSAMTLDGKIATASGDSKWITSDKSRRYVHSLRAVVDAVMVGSGTVEVDDPLLTARIPNGRDPMRVIVDSRLRIAPKARLLQVESTASTVIATVSDDAAKIARLEKAGASVVRCSEKDGRVDLVDLMHRLGAMQVQSILLEGGSELAGEMLRSGLIDKFLLFYAPKLVGGGGKGPFGGAGVEKIADASMLREISVRRFDEDILITAYPEMQCSRD
ncbi:MAG: bifunctional diaminohydroxyphosphoribosylaminopyrimidine deaminase/5-amino-6-(5-phosphoribosylamino)uracil reductase RibD [Geobacter sp.]|nr:bifunctional diaminohydroxyphosphoribosylaminopyrimidine deaminase/5-amino-6-(5-phosphoribosylamino)uracil reductase RibD [Geobacter sp.]